MQVFTTQTGKKKIPNMALSRPLQIVIDQIGTVSQCGRPILLNGTSKAERKDNAELIIQKNE